MGAIVPRLVQRRWTAHPSFCSRSRAPTSLMTAASSGKTPGHVGAALDPAVGPRQRVGRADLGPVPGGEARAGQHVRRGAARRGRELGPAGAVGRGAIDGRPPPVTACARTPGRPRRRPCRSRPCRSRPCRSRPGRCAAGSGPREPRRREGNEPGAVRRAVAPSPRLVAAAFRPSWASGTTSLTPRRPRRARPRRNSVPNGSARPLPAVVPPAPRAGRRCSPPRR